MTKNKILKIAAVGSLFLALTSNAFAKDWIEKVKLSQGIVDTNPIEVSATLNGYTGVKTKNHMFLFNMYAKATNGERIVALALGAYGNVKYFEHPGSFWDKTFEGRDVGGGTKRTVKLYKTFNVPVSKLAWIKNPVDLCNANLANKTKKGLSKTEVLSKEWTIKAAAYFELDAVAARKGKAKNGKWNISNTTNQRSGAPFTVYVKCNAGLKKAP